MSKKNRQVKICAPSDYLKAPLTKNASYASETASKILKNETCEFFVITLVQKYVIYGNRLLLRFNYMVSVCTIFVSLDDVLKNYIKIPCNRITIQVRYMYVFCSLFNLYMIGAGQKYQFRL